jgi:hypothetical protein
MWFVSEEDEQRFAHALLASLLVHVLVLGYVKGVEPLRKPGFGGALNVSFRAPAAAERRQVTPPLPDSVPATTTALVQVKVPAPPLAAVKPDPAPVPAVERIGTPRAAAPAAEGQGSHGRAATAKGPGVVKVMLIIGADGHPQGIYWNALPALTTAQFEQLEAMIRRQVYASSTGARLTQEIDVFDLLGIGRRAAALAPVPAEAPPPQ